MEFRKSSFSTAAPTSCVEAGAEAWQSPSFSFANGNCVQAAGAQFTKSGDSGANGSCVEAATAGYARAAASNPDGACVEAATALYAKSSGSSMNGGCVEAGAAEFARSSGAVNCVEAGTVAFRSPDGSGDTNCVEAGEHDHAGSPVFVRDSKITPDANGEFPHLHFDRGTWDGGRAVEFGSVRISDVPQDLLDVTARRGHDREQRWYSVTSGSPQDKDTILYFDQAEKDAWCAGVRNGEFTLAAAPVAA